MESHTAAGSKSRSQPEVSGSDHPLPAQAVLSVEAEKSLLYEKAHS